AFGMVDCLSQASFLQATACRNFDVGSASTGVGSTMFDFSGSGPGAEGARAAADAVRRCIRRDAQEARRQELPSSPESPEVAAAGGPNGAAGSMLLALLKGKPAIPPMPGA
ncbi:unnamed protein product, partial [Polarella glacialis]